jgi:hypothetical protein
MVLSVGGETRTQRRLRASFIIVLTASRARPRTIACFASLLSVARRLSVTLDDHEGAGPDLDDGDDACIEITFANR